MGGISYKISYKEAGTAVTNLFDYYNLIVVASSKDLGTEAITGAVAGIPAPGSPIIDPINEIRIVAESRAPESYVLGANVTNIQIVTIAEESYATSADTSGDSPINLDASKVVNALSIYANDGDNIILATSNDDSIQGYGGDDTITGGNGNDTIYAGDGNDTLILKSIDQYDSDYLDGGNDTDTLLVNDTVAGSLNLTSSFYSIENITIGSLNKGKIDTSGKIDINVNASSTTNNPLNITGNAGNNSLTGNDQGDSFTGGLGNDTLIGGTSYDTFIYNSDKELGSSEGIDGGEGGNAIWLEGAGNYKFLVDNQLSNVGEIDFAESKINITLDVSQQSESFNIYLNDGNNNVSGGSGNDAVYIGSGNNTIKLGNGNNSLNLSNGMFGPNYATGNNNITGGTGNDSFISGDGNDTINDLGGNNSINAGLGKNNIKTGAGNDSIDLDLRSTNMIDAGNGDNSFNITFSGSFPPPPKAIFGSNNITTGTGNDNMSLDYRTSNIINAGDGNNIIGFGYTVPFGANTFGKNTVTTGNGNDSINIDIRTSNTLSLGDGFNTVSGGINGPSDKPSFGTNTINSGVDSDYISLSYSNGNDTVNDKGGSNTIYLGDGKNTVKLDGQDSLGSNNVYTGSGDDVVTFSGINGETNNGQNNINVGNGNNKVTTIGGNDYIISGKGNDIINAGDGQNSIYGGAGNDVINTGNGNDIIYAGQGNDTVNAGIGNDTIYADISMGGPSDGNGIDSLTGGAGGDTFVISHIRWGAKDIINGDGKGVTAGDDVDKLILADTADYAKPADEIFKVDGSKITGIEEFYIDDDTIQGNTRGTANIGLDLSAYKTAAYIEGNDGSNTLIGTKGNDTITGYSGGDILTGGAGNDTFVFHDANNYDSITDFVSGKDTIGFDSGVFGFNSETISASNLVVANSYSELLSSQTTSSQYLLFDTSTGNLFFDADANGTEVDPTQIATLVGVSSVTFSDFMLI